VWTCRRRNNFETPAALAGPILKDDSDRLHLTIIGSSQLRQKVLDDLRRHDSLREFAGRCHVHNFPPDHWAVVKTGFVTTGSPTIYLQSANGRVLHRQDNYAGPDNLAEALRRADPNYQPDKDPNWNSLNRLDWKRLPAWAWVCLALFLFLALRRRSNQ
jgi:hypothetical protein